ncbi:MAG: response regulator [Blastocatellia bacterium]
MGYKILLADDSVTVQKIITLTFSDEGVDVQTVNNGDEAINRLQYMRPALVMADVSIPGKNGYDICEFVKNHPEMKDTPVVLLVPAFEPFDEERARRIGANQHLTKPFQSIRTLISTVKGLLESHPPKITAPLTPNAGGMGNLSLAKLIEEKKAETEAVQPSPAAAPATQPFPPDAEQRQPLIPIENLLEVETESELSEPEPVLEPVTEPEPIVAAAEQDEEFVEEIETPIFAEAVQPAQSVRVEEITISAVETQNGVASDLDHILDLDDVLPEIWPQPSPVAAFTPTTETQSAAVEFANDPQLSASSTIPQNVIDEIVNRVVAQLSEKLMQKLAIQLAPEVAEIVKQQTQLGPSTIPAASRRESGPLLELD